MLFSSSFCAFLVLILCLVALCCSGPAVFFFFFFLQPLWELRFGPEFCCPAPAPAPSAAGQCLLSEVISV